MMSHDISSVDGHQVLLGEVQTYRALFPHFVAERVFDPAVCGNLLRWLETDISWKLHSDSFFELYTCNLSRVSIPCDCAALFETNVLLELKRRMELLFETELADRWNIVAHKLLPNQKIGIHNDAPNGKSETHRLIVHLNRGWREQDGGYLAFFSGDHPNDIARVFQPLHNTGVGFALSDDSYHAVSEVHQGVRYSIVYSFWQKSSDD